MLTQADISAEVEGQTVTSRFRDTVRELPDRVALRAKDGDGWVEYTYADYADSACKVAAGLGAAGLQKGDRVVLMMRNIPEFHWTDMGVLLAGGTPISIYNSSAPDQVQYLVSHCGATVAIVEDEEFLGRIQEVWDQLPDLKTVFVLHTPESGLPDGVSDWDELTDHDPVDLDEAAEICAPEDLLTLIYTSGTTGPPKGVMLSHHNITWLSGSYDHVPQPSRSGMRLVSYLPMAHIAERAVSYYMATLLGQEVTTCPDPKLLAEYLPECRPQLFFAVPRVWEKLYGGIQSALAADPERKQKFDEAVAVGDQVRKLRESRQEIPAELQETYDFVDAVAFSNVKALIGLDQCEIAVTGAAPIPPEIINFFSNIGIPLSSVYGLSETTGPITWTHEDRRTSTVGPAIPGCQVILGEDGEVLGKGGNIFLGYYNDPERTAEVMDDEGWFHTGDIGEFDDDGQLRIVDRKKELIITAGGKNISPANLEAALKAHNLVGQVCVIGDNKPFLSALIVVDGDVAPAWAAAQGIEFTTMADFIEEPVVRQVISDWVTEANGQFSRVEQIKKYTLLGEEWQPDSEFLTPTMKLKRRGVHSTYVDEIEAMYN
ncbi:MAG: long-chain fatty acid--CoA ligase [Actinobacteria bacterium]|nr:long-chain fatty acid--CoA ligase [Actinomycetota bacterium]